MPRQVFHAHNILLGRSSDNIGVIYLDFYLFFSAETYLRSVAYCRCCWCFFFFFQAEDGIRDYKVTGVQTCALPIWIARVTAARADRLRPLPKAPRQRRCRMPPHRLARKAPATTSTSTAASALRARYRRSEERRVGKEGISRWGRAHEKKKRDQRDNK